MFESIFFKFIFIVFICLLVIFIMNYFYRKNVKNKIINYLLSCSNLEQEILKSFLQNPHKTFHLTKDAKITKNLLQLNIIFLKE
ncbi:super-infection exclusion protein B, partial [Candidatus Phytoplasma sp. Tabriz.2]|nr:super-infection exclusion protein B [Candidatus Phytoplasma australiense]